MSSPPKKKVIILGKSGIGKTSLMNRFVTGEFTIHQSSTQESIQHRPHKEVQVGGRKCLLEIWDTEGEEMFMSISENFYSGTHVCVLMYDITEKSTFHGDSGPSSWKQEFEDMMVAGAPPVTFICIGNKVDKEDQRQVDTLEAATWCQKESGVHHFETSAKEGTGVDEVFTEIARLALSGGGPPQSLPEKLTKKLWKKSGRSGRTARLSIEAPLTSGAQKLTSIFNGHSWDQRLVSVDANFFQYCKPDDPGQKPRLRERISSETKVVKLEKINDLLKGVPSTSIEGGLQIILKTQPEVIQAVLAFESTTEMNTWAEAIEIFSSNTRDKSGSVTSDASLAISNRSMSLASSTMSSGSDK